MANQFNNFFANTGRNLSDKISRKSDKHVTTFLKQEVLSTFDFQCIDCIDVKKTIHNIAAKNSCGIDAISTKLIKMIGDDIARPPTLMINQSLSTGVFPDKLKIAKVIPLYKMDDPHLVDNFRPISLLTAISKIFEKIVFNQVYAYFDRNELLYTSQYGFRKLHSTELASLELVDRVRLDMDSGKMSLSIFLDISKAFDTLDHSILLLKLTIYGLSLQQYGGSQATCRASSACWRWRNVVHITIHLYRSTTRLHLRAIIFYHLYERHTRRQR